jgi:hypothetical protein
LLMYYWLSGSHEYCITHKMITLCPQCYILVTIIHQNENECQFHKFHISISCNMVTMICWKSHVSLFIKICQGTHNAYVTVHITLQDN